MSIEEQKQQWITDILNDPTNWERFYVFADWLDDNGLALEAEQWRYRGQYFGGWLAISSSNDATKYVIGRLRLSITPYYFNIDVPLRSDRRWCESKNVRYIPHWPAIEADLEKTLT